MPLGPTSVNWLATDNSGAVTSAVQSLVVTDTTPPANPLLTSPTHLTGVWSSESVATVLSAGSTDVCTGVRGFSYAWSRDAPAVPDTVVDPSVTTTATTITTTTVDSQSFATAAWPAGWTRSSATYIRLTNAVGRVFDTYAAGAVGEQHHPANGQLLPRLRPLGIRLCPSGVSGQRFNAQWRHGLCACRVLRQWWCDLHAAPGSLTAGSAWSQRSYALPTGGTVRVRFSGSVNATTEYANWDQIESSGYTSSTSTWTGTSSTASLADGRWYFNLSAADNAGNWSAPRGVRPPVDRHAAARDLRRCVSRLEHQPGGRHIDRD